MTIPLPGPAASVLSAVLVTNPNDPASPPRRATFSQSGQAPLLPSLANDVVTMPQDGLLDANGTWTGFLSTLGLAGATAPARWVGATAAGAPSTGGPFAKGDFVIDQTGLVWVCTTAGSPGIWTVPTGAPSGAATGDLSGNYPNPSVAKVKGIALSGTPAAGQVLTATSPTAANWQAVAGPPAGMQFMSGGGTITATTITNAIAAGFTGLFLDPRFVWDMSGLVINGVKNFTIESRMAGSIGWVGNIAYSTGGYITTSTGSPADGIQVYSSAPGSAQTQGVIFKNCVIVGANSNATVHFGGGQRRCGLVDTLAYNTLSFATTVAAGSNGVAVSTFTGTQSLSVAAVPSATTGNVVVATSTGWAVLSYSGTGAGTLTNVTLIAGTGTLATGGSVQLAAFGAITDTALSANNSEDMIFSFTGGGGLAGAFGALGIGINTLAQAANDTAYYDLATSAGQFGIVKVNGGGHTFTNYYDRSSPAIATVWNHGGARLTFVGGEDQNGVGLSHLIDVSAAQTLLINRTVTQFSTQTTTMNISAGSLVMRGPCAFNVAQTVALSGTGVLDLSDVAVNAANATISGSAGTLLLAASYPGSGNPPVLSSWTGPIQYPGPAAVAAIRVTAQTGANTLTWTPPAVTGIRFRVSVYISVSVAGTSTVPVLAYHGIGSTTPSFTVPMWLGNSAAAAPSYTCATLGEYYGTWEADTDGTATAVTLTVTPTGSTYRLSAVIERLT